MTYCSYCEAQIVQPDAKFCPSCGRALSQNVVAPVNAPASIAQTFDIHSVLQSNEHIAWHLDFKEGVIHRHVNKTYIITNFRVIAVDAEAGKVIISLPIQNTDAVVMDRHTSSQSVGGGVYHGGLYSGERSGSSKTVGALVFVSGGVERIRLERINDPEGVKNLFAAVKKEALQSLR